MTTLNEAKNSDSLINIFVSGDNPATALKDQRKSTANSQSTSDDNRTIESFNMSVRNSNSDLTLKEENDENEWFAKMSKQEIFESIFGPALNIKNLTYMEKGKKILHSNYFHVAVVALIILDSLFVTVELIMSAEYCEKKIETLKTVGEIFKYMGLTILSLFMVELILKIVFLNKEILKSKLEIFDALVVLVSFGFEMAFINNEELETIGQLTSIFRLWRLVRIVNGFIMTVERRADAKIAKLKDGLNALIRETEMLKQELNTLKKNCPPSNEA